MCKMSRDSPPCKCLDEFFMIVLLFVVVIFYHKILLTPDNMFLCLLQAKIALFLSRNVWLYCLLDSRPIQIGM